MTLSRSVAAVGIGYSALSRTGDPDARTLTLDAAMAALSDAGLEPGTVDGIVQYADTSDTTETPHASYLSRALGIPNLAYFMDLIRNGPSGVGAAMAAAMAVASGVCDTVLAYRTLTRQRGHKGGVSATPEELAGPLQFTLVYGHTGGLLANYAMKKRRRMHEFGNGPEEYGLVAINARRWAALNPRAVLKDPLTMADYLDARVIVDPLLLLDCDYPINGSCAVVFTTAERARDLRRRPVLVDSMSWGNGPGSDLVFSDDLLYGGSSACSEQLWSRSSFRADDVDVLQLYDGFTHLPISWTEALGFCGPGEFYDWADGGRTIGPGGSHPINTSGGMLAEGRVQGIGLVAEAVAQLRGEGGERQVPDARVAVVAGGGSSDCGAMVLHVD